MAQLDPGSSPALRRARALSLFGSSTTNEACTGGHATIDIVIRASGNVYHVHIKLRDRARVLRPEVTLLGDAKQRGYTLEPEAAGVHPGVRRHVYRVGASNVEGAEWVVADTKLAAAPQEDVHYELFVELVYKD